MSPKTGYFFNQSSLLHEFEPDVPESPRRLDAINARIAASDADRSCRGRIVPVLEGGYDLTGSAAAVEAPMKALVRIKPPSPPNLSTEKTAW